MLNQQNQNVFFEAPSFKILLMEVIPMNLINIFIIIKT